MTLLLDSHLLLWAASNNPLLPVAAGALIRDPSNQPAFSVASIWEIVIKRSLGRSDFQVDPYRLRAGLLENDYLEIPVLGSHTLAVSNLPDLHKDPFDRILLAQAMVEGFMLLTSDPALRSYPGPIIRF